MISVKNIKDLPKISVHINLLTSVITEDINDLIDITTFKRINDIDKCIETSLNSLRDDLNIELSINKLIDKLIEDDVIYSELFVDLNLYKKIDLNKLVELILFVKEKRNYDLNLVLMCSDKLEKEENLEVLNVLDKYYKKGVNGIYFKKEKSTNIEDYVYIFDRLIKNNIDYIVPLDQRINNNNYEIYSKAKRIEYLSDNYEEILEIINENNIIEICLTKLNELNIENIYEFINILIDNNYNYVLTSTDMTLLNTDLVNEYCLLINNIDLDIHSIIKNIINNINLLNIEKEEKERLIMILKGKSNEIL